MKKLFGLLLFATCVSAQSLPQPLWVIHVYDITSPNQVQDMRSNTRQCNMFTFSVTSGTGNWGVQLEYSDTSSSGPWTIFAAGAPAVSYSNPSAVGYGYGYHPWVRLDTTAGTTAVNLSCEKDFYFPSGTGITQLTGDASAGPGTGDQNITLSTVNSNPGTFGDSSHSLVATVNAKGLVTNVTTVPISGGAKSYSQSFTNATTVNIAHDLDSLYIYPQVFDTSGATIGYQSFTRTDANNAVLTFATAQSGTITILSAASGVYSQSFTNATTVSVAHNLGTLSPLATVFDSSNNVIGYSSLTPTDSDNETLVFSVPQSGSIVLIRP